LIVALSVEDADHDGWVLDYFVSQHIFLKHELKLFATVLAFKLDEMRLFNIQFELL
jgi:hypothetical protein